MWSVSQHNIQCIAVKRRKFTTNHGDCSSMGVKIMIFMVQFYGFRTLPRDFYRKNTPFAFFFTTFRLKKKTSYFQKHFRNLSGI